jgi:hypothetical protein
MNSASLDEVQRVWQEASRPDRLYPLFSHGWSYGFYTGRVPGDRQAIAFWDGPEDVALLLFDRSGVYVGNDRRRVRPMPNAAAEPSDDEPAHAHLRHEFGFVAGPIKVRRFHEPRWVISVEPLADCYLEFVRDPIGYTKGDEQEVLDLTEVVRGWVEEGRFAFSFYNEFWMSADGEVECS